MSAVKKAVWFSYGFQFFFGLLLWLPVFYEYQRQIGLSDEQIFGIQSIYYIAFCLLEIPTGMVADRFDYRHCLVVGAVVLVGANLVPVFLADYTGFLVHFLLIALARSLVSGAASAYLYEYMHAAGEGEHYPQAEGYGRSYSLIGKVVCWPVVGLLMQWNLPSPYWLSAINAAIAVGMALLLPAVPGGLTKAQRPPVATALRGAFTQLRGSTVLVLLMVQGVAIFTLARICTVNLFQPILDLKDTPVTMYGVVMALMTVFEALGAARPNWLRKRISDLGSVFVLTVVMALALALTAALGVLGTVLALCVFSLACGLSFPIQRALLNQAITDSRYRATLLSIESIIDRAVCALVAVVLGSSLGAGELGGFLLATAIVTILLMLVVAGLLRLARRRRGSVTVG
ncbi:MFS transporter [Kutzneria viridogrisea]|uniref:MFS family permease n=1 Tax=Kutzneria viridogrisea TaxID=47990 RepID=A0ABR6BEM5_9PSEU|nr:MFS family permease [Kutzneria viridogrisea]